jgi:hypothetical protein
VPGSAAVLDAGSTWKNCTGLEPGGKQVASYHVTPRPKNGEGMSSGVNNVPATRPQAAMVA